MIGAALVFINPAVLGLPQARGIFLRMLAGAWLTWENVIDVGASYSSSPRQQHQKIPCAW
jgi:hypothetical protein